MFIDSLLSDSLESYCPSLLLHFKEFELYWGGGLSSHIFMIFEVKLEK